MADSLTVTIQLSPEAREFVRQSVERGQYPSEGDLVSHSVESMMCDAEQIEGWMEEPSEEALNVWMQEVVGPIYDRMQADPRRGIPPEDVLTHLEERRRARKKSA